jgi:hypothetical protein
MAVFEASKWESLVWPRWIPVPARLPLVAQITGAVALTALIVGPWWSQIPDTPIPLQSTAAEHLVPVPLPRPVAPSPAITRLDAATRTAASDHARPAHLNLDVRHTFGEMDLSVTVDGKPAFANQLGGGGKRFKMFGKRAERGFTRTLDLAPGVHVVRVRLQSPEDRFDHTRVERFDLGPASVAGLQITADKSGMALVATHPPPPPKPKATPMQSATALPAPIAPAAAAPAVPAAPPGDARPSPAESAVLELVHSLRSMLIAIAGFVASAATGFVVQEFLRRRKGLLFADAAAQAPSSMERRRRRRAARGQRDPAASPE